MVELLGSDELKVKSEEEVLAALRAWFEHDEEARKASLEELVPLVRWPQLPAEALMQLGSEPSLLLNCPTPLAIRLMAECSTAFAKSPAAADCPRLRRRTDGGKVFTFCILILGLGIVTVPAGVLASALAKAREME